MKSLRTLIHAAAIITATSAVTACNGPLDLLGMFHSQSDSPDERFEQSRLYSDSHPIRTFETASDDYKVYLCADPHLEGSASRLDTFVKDYLADSEAAPFCLCLGDLIDTREGYGIFTEHMAPIMQSDRDTIFCTIGNHDLFFNRWPEYAGIFKTSTYSFEAATPGGAKDLFICLDSGSGTVGARQLEWLRDKLEGASKAGYRHITVFTHTHFFKKDSHQGHTSNYDMEETYELLGLFSRYGVDTVLNGHVHARDDSTFGGIRYVTVDAIIDEDERGFYSIATFGSDGVGIRHVEV